MSYYDPDLKRNVLLQDAEQIQQSTKKARETRERKEQSDYDAAQKEYERDVKSAEEQYKKDVAKYEKELAEYNRQKAEAEKQANQQNKYDAEIAKLQAEKQKALSDAHYEVWGPGGSRNRSELNTKQNTIIKNYDSKINKAVEQKRVETGYQEFAIAFPGQVLPSNVAKTFRESPSFSLTDLYQTKMESKAIQAERRRQSSAQSAQNIARRESIEYHSNIPNIGFISSGLGTERGAAVKPLPDAPTGKKAVETRRPLINVKTVENIYGGQQIETNPRAFVASLTRQDVDAAGKPTKPIRGEAGPQSIFSFENVSDVQDPSAIALLEFQSQLKTKTAPSATVYKGILEERGLPVTPLATRIIDTYSSKGLFRDYKEPVPAKGRKAIISKDGKQIFDMETGLGDVTLGRKLGFVYDYNLQRPTEEKSGMFAGSLAYLVQPKVQGPQQPKLEEAKAFPGSLEYVVASEPKETKFNKSLENQYNKLGELQEITAKKAKSGDPRDILVQIAYAPSEAMRSIIGAGGSIVNLFEQNIDPITEKQLNLKRTARPTPIIFTSDVAGTTVLPYQFEKGRFDVSFEEYAQRQKQFIEKKGLPAYATGIGFDYAGLKGVPSLIKTGARVTPKLFSVIAKPALPRIGRAAREAALLGSTGKITTPSRMWDVAEPVQKVGLRIERKVQPTWAVQKQQLPVPNPFGKERVIPYYLRQGITKVSDFGKRVIEKPRGLATPIWLKNFSDISLNPAHLGTKPNIPTRLELEKPPEYKRANPNWQIMRDIFYPTIPAPRPKAQLIPTGFTKINPKMITVKKSAKQIIKLPSIFKSKISIPKLSSPKFIKKSQQQWQGFVFMQKKRFGEFKESLPTLPSLPKPKANQFVTFQRKARDIKSGILETKRLSFQLFEWPVAKKPVVPAFGKQQLRNLTREDIGIPSNIKSITTKKERPLSFGIAPAKSPPFMEGFIEKPFRARRGRSPIEISRFSDVSGLGSISPKPQSFYNIRKRFPRQPVEFGIIPKGTGMDALKGPAAEWSKNWMLKQRKVSAQDYLYRMEKVQGKRQWVEYPLEINPIEKTKMFYHGTSPEAAEKILTGGFGSKTNDLYTGATGDFISEDFTYAAMYSDLTTKGKLGKVLGLNLSKDAKVADTSKIARKLGLEPGKEFEPNVLKKITKFAYEQKYDALSLFDLETVVFNPKIIKISKVFDVTPTGEIIKEYALPTFRSALPSKATRITSERYRQMPKMDSSWPTPPKPVQGDEFMNQLIALRRQPKESGMLLSDPRRTQKVNVRMIKNEMEGMGYFKTATPFQLKQPKLADWPDNWKNLAKSKLPDVDDYLSQKRSFRSFGKTEKEKMLKGVIGAGASSYPDVSFARFGKQKGVPTTMFTQEKATLPIATKTERRTGMFRMLERSAEEQEKLDKMWGQGMARVLKERKKGDLPSITTRIDDTAQTISGKAKLSFVSEPMRVSPIVVQRGRGIFDTKLTVRKGKLVKGLKPVRGTWGYLQDKFAETRKAPKGRGPMNLAPWKAPKLPEPKEPDVFFKRERIGRNVLRDDKGLPNIVPSLITEKQKFTLTKIKLGKGKTDTFGRKFEKSPLDSPVKDLPKRTNWDKLASESKKEREKKDRAWEESQKAPKGGQILVPPEPRNPLKLPDPEVPVPEAFGDVGAKVPFKKDKYKIPLIIPPTPKETKKERQVQTSQDYESIILSDNRPKISTIQTPRISLDYSTPQRVQESFRMKTIQPAKITIAQKPRQATRQRQRSKTIQVPKYEIAQIQRVSPRQAQKQTPKLASPLAPKAPTKLRAPQRQPVREKPKQITLLRTRPPRRPPRVVFALPPDREPEKKKSKKESKDIIGFYLGNVPLDRVEGMFGRRREITLGKEKIIRTLRGDVRVLAGKPRNVKRSKKQDDMFGFSKKKTKFF